MGMKRRKSPKKKEDCKGYRIQYHTPASGKMVELWQVMYEEPEPGYVGFVYNTKNSESEEWT